MTDPAPVVWLVNEGGHDYETLAQFGRMMPLTRGSVNPFNLDRMMVNFGIRLSSATENDYLAISGLPVLNALALTMWLMKFPRCNLLHWSMKKEQYVPIILLRTAVEKNSTGDPNRPAD